MAEGLRPHHHQEFEYRTEQYFDKKRSCLVKKIQYMCMICGHVRYEKYDCYVPPPKSKTKSLERNKKKLLHPFMPFITEEIWQNLKLFAI